MISFIIMNRIENLFLDVLKIPLNFGNLAVELYLFIWQYYSCSWLCIFYTWAEPISDMVSLIFTVEIYGRWLATQNVHHWCRFLIFFPGKKPHRFLVQNEGIYAFTINFHRWGHYGLGRTLLSPAHGSANGSFWWWRICAFYKAAVTTWPRGNCLLQRIP